MLLPVGWIFSRQCSRKIILRSSQILIIAVVLTVLPFTLSTVLAAMNNHICSTVGFIAIGITAVLLYLAVNVSFIGFNANVIQFGMEQLHDSPADHQSLFIYWYVWIYYLVQILIEQPWNIISSFSSTVGTIMFIIILPSSFVIIVVSLCVAYRKRNWFLVNPATVNPYKLVYKITRFARQHKVPIRRSAFTYCEDEIPTGLDLAKTKYGGPYTTEEVENVKAFYGILKILLCLGPFFFCSYAADVPLFWIISFLLGYWDMESSDATQVYNYIFADNTLSSMIIVALIPLHLIIGQQFSCCHSLNMLRRIGLGMLFFILALVCTAACVSYIFDLNYVIYNSITCVTNVSPNGTDHSLCAVAYILPMLPRFLYGVSNLLIYTALYEFICAQSPLSMKGLLIGLSFAIQGIYQALGAAFAIPFFTDTMFGQNTIWYYGVNIVLAVVVFILFCFFSRRYKYRQRDEICEVYRYAEEYYSNNQTEENYD